MSRGPLLGLRKFLIRRRHASPGRLVRLALWELKQSVLDRARGVPHPRDLAVETTVSVSLDPPQVTLNFTQTNVAASTTTIYKRPFGKVNHASWGDPYASLSGDQTTFVDRAVEVGKVYEYGLVRRHRKPPYRSTGRVCAALRRPLNDLHDPLLLLVERSHEAALEPEIRRLVRDLVADGYPVVRRSVARDDAPASVKALIRSVVDEHPTLRTLFLLGHVPVPYSGNTSPDGHTVPAPGSPAHKGAWPADVYYADLVGTWTDDVVDTRKNSYPPGDPRNENLPGDGKLDQDELPCDAVSLEVGRVDLSDLPAFRGLSEEALLRRYLDKNHAFRQGRLRAQPRALVDDNFGYFMTPKNRPRMIGKGFSTGAYRSFSACLGPDKVREGDLFADLRDVPHLFAYGCGPGHFDECGGIGTTEELATNDPQALFFVLLGSYFGDWDNPNNFLRAPLATSHGLTSVWGGIPDWSLHVLGVGETWGFALQFTQNLEGYDEDNDRTIRQGTSIHVALHGDPTLPLQVVSPPGSARARWQGKTVLVEIDGRDTSHLGYHVYRAPSELGPFKRLSKEPVQPPFVDVEPTPDEPYYLVRAVALLTTASGTYYQASTGVLSQVPST